MDVNTFEEETVAELFSDFFNLNPKNVQTTTSGFRLS